MWVRKRIDVSWLDLGWALAQCALPADRDRITRRYDEFSENQLLITMSVRSGFDLLWDVLGFEQDSEILFSGFTIPDMPKIVVEHGLRPIAIDLDVVSMGPNIEELRSKITPRTRAIVVAHLWGGLVDLSRVADIADEHDLLLIEDCAQSFAQCGDWGDSRADISMFSFGSIKTNSALGGAILRVSNDKLAKDLIQIHEQLPLQTRFSYFCRLLKYFGVKTISLRPIAAVVCRAFSAVGADHDQFAAKLAKGFAGRSYFKRIRRRPSVPLLKLLYRKLLRFQRSQIDRRQRLGEYLAWQICSRHLRQDDSVGFDHQTTDVSDRPLVVGAQMLRQTFWVFAILVEHPEKLVARLWKAGFDATQQASLRAIDLGKRGRNPFSTCAMIQDHIVYLPMDFAMPASEVDRMIDVIHASNATCPQEWIAMTAEEQHADLSPCVKRASENSKS